MELKVKETELSQLQSELSARENQLFIGLDVTREKQEMLRRAIEVSSNALKICSTMDDSGTMLKKVIALAASKLVDEINALYKN
jgi:hypothetical protein